MTVYYWHNQGRLGNLLLQYAAIRRFSSEEDRVLCFENSLFAAIETEARFRRIPCPTRFRKGINFVTNLLIDQLAKLRLISSMGAEKVPLPGKGFSEGRGMVRSKGLFSSLCQVKGYFQHEAWLFDALKFKPDVVARARAALSTLSNSQCKVGIQIRLGDYRNWSVLGKKGVALDGHWYNRAIAQARARLDNPAFIVFTDDREAVRALGLDTPFVIFEGDNALEDLIGLSLCEHAIVSPSSFAFCGVMASWSAGKIIIAPKYWIGFKSRCWVPPSIETPLIHFLEVEHE